MENEGHQNQTMKEITNRVKSLGDKLRSQMFDCPDCNGTGMRNIDRFVKSADGCKFEHQTVAKCERCDGDGFVSEEEANRIKAGKLIRQARQLLDLSLMEFAKELNIKASELSDIEMGRKVFKRC